MQRGFLWKHRTDMDIESLIKDVVGSQGSSAGADPGQQHGIVTGLLHMISSQGGVGGFTDHLRNNGLGSQVDSWVGNGENQAVAPQQVQSALGQNRITELAQRAGVSPAIAGTIAATVLPMLINKLTPGGQVPAGNSLSGMLGGLGGMLGGLGR